MRRIWALLVLSIVLAGCGRKIAPPQDLTTLIAPPSGLSALIITNSTLELTWDDNSDNEDGFEISRREASDTSSAGGGEPDSTGAAGDSLSVWSVFDSILVNATVYYDSSVAVGKKYYYRIKAYNSQASSDFSNTAIISFAVPRAPSGLIANVLSDSKIALSWTDNSDNETNFLVCRQDTGVVIITNITSTNETGYIDTNLTGNTSYSYYIIATNSLGNTPSETVVITTLTTISVIGSIPGPISSFPNFISAQGDYVYLAGFWGVNKIMKIIDVSIPESPTLSGQYSISFQPYDLFVKGAYAYLARDSGFVMIDISAPDSPILTDEYIKSPGTHFIGVSDDYIFLASNNALPDSLLIIEYSDSIGFLNIGAYEEQQEITSLFVDDSLAYILAGGALKIISVIDPANPVVVGYFNPEYSSDEIYVRNEHVYMPNDFGFTITNVANPLAPVASGSYLLSGGIEKVFADSGYAYIYNRSDVLRVIDVTIPALPDLVARFDNSTIGSLFALGDYIYVSNSDSLQVLYIEDEEN